MDAISAVCRGPWSLVGIILRSVLPGLACLVIAACKDTLATGGQTNPNIVCDSPGPTLSPSSTVLRVGDTVRVRAVLPPPPCSSERVVWSTMNAAVARVDSVSGLVTAVGIGFTEIVASERPDSVVTSAVSLTVVN
jgi:hypothetical protein